MLCLSWQLEEKHYYTTRLCCLSLSHTPEDVSGRHLNEGEKRVRELNQISRLKTVMLYNKGPHQKTNNPIIATYKSVSSYRWPSYGCHHHGYSTCHRPNGPGALRLITGQRNTGCPFTTEVKFRPIVPTTPRGKNKLQSDSQLSVSRKRFNVCLQNVNWTELLTVLSLRWTGAKLLR